MHVFSPDHDWPLFETVGDGNLLSFFFFFLVNWSVSLFLVGTVSVSVLKYDLHSQKLLPVDRTSSWMPSGTSPSPNPPILGVLGHTSLCVSVLTSLFLFHLPLFPDRRC